MNKKPFSVVFSQPSGSFIPKEIRTHCYLASLLRKQFMSQPHATSCIQPTDQENNRSIGIGTSCASIAAIYFSWMFGDPHFSFRRSIPFPCYPF